MTREPMTAQRAAELIAAHSEEVSSDQLCPHPLVSVCVVTYNHGPFIRQALDSILAQETSFPFEVMIGDDHSSDGTRQIVLEYQRQNPDKIRILLATENLGRFTGNGRLNFARSLLATRAKYVALLDGDDCWTSNGKLQKQVDYLESNRACAGSFHDTSRIDERGETLDLDPVPFHNLDLLPIRDIVSPVLCFHTSSFVFRSSALPSAFPDWFYQAQSGDLALFSLAALTGPIGRVDGCLSAWRRHPGGITALPTYKGAHRHLGRIQLWTSLRSHLDEADQDAVDDTCLWHASQMVDSFKKIERSYSFRIGLAITAPLRYVHRLLRRKGKNNELRTAGTQSENVTSAVRKTPRRAANG